MDEKIKEKNKKRSLKRRGEINEIIKILLVVAFFVIILIIYFVWFRPALNSAGESTFLGMRFGG